MKLLWFLLLSSFCYVNCTFILAELLPYILQAKQEAENVLSFLLNQSQNFTQQMQDGLDRFNEFKNQTCMEYMANYSLLVEQMFKPYGNCLAYQVCQMEPTCPKNEEWGECDRNCGNVHCTMFDGICPMRCRCIRGYYRRADTKLCVMEAECYN